MGPHDGRVGSSLGAHNKAPVGHQPTRGSANKALTGLDSLHTVEQARCNPILHRCAVPGSNRPTSRARRRIARWPMDAESFVANLNGVHKGWSGWSAKCPSHDDT